MWKKLSELLDYLESSSASVVMIRYPTLTPVADMLAAFQRRAKWVFMGGSFALLMVGAVVGVWQWVKAIRHPDVF